MNMEKAQRIVLICHSNPDGDAIGSLLGLSILLKEKFPHKSVVNVCKDPAPSSLKFLAGSESVQDHYEPRREDLIIFLDSAEPKLISFSKSLPRIFNPDNAKEDGITTIKVDHHPTGTKYAHLDFVDTEAASSCEIVVDIADAMDFKISPPAATCLLTGVYTDTGSMMHSNTSKRVYRTCARLLRAGADQETIVENVYRTTKLSTLKLWGRVLEKINLSEEGGAVSAISAGDFKATGADFSELTGAIDYVNSIPGMKFSLILSERDGKVKGSLRTLREDVDVSEMAQKFSGGGHRKAAGFSLDGSLEQETRWKVVPASDTASPVTNTK
jgi:bifunctional oligoribonuclease and PAP phosphatase NrnA